MNNVRKIAAGATLIGALIGGGALTAMALPTNAGATVKLDTNFTITATEAGGQGGH